MSNTKLSDGEIFALVIILAFFAGFFTGGSAQWHQFGHPPATTHPAVTQEKQTDAESREIKFNPDWTVKIPTRTMGSNGLIIVETIDGKTYTIEIDGPPLFDYVSWR